MIFGIMNYVIRNWLTKWILQQNQQRNCYYDRNVINLFAYEQFFLKPTTTITKKSKKKKESYIVREEIRRRANELCN